jgi:hypothetical protein
MADEGRLTETTSGGAFEATSTPWSLSGGASVVAGNEPYFLHAMSDTHSLALPAGSSATSWATCAPMITSIVRFAVRNTGSPTGLLHVQMLVNGGKDGILDGGYLMAGDSWQTGARLFLPWANPLQGAVSLQVRLTPVGEGAVGAGCGQTARQAESTHRAESNGRRRRTRASFYRSETWSAMRPRIGLAT